MFYRVYPQYCPRFLWKTLGKLEFKKSALNQSGGIILECVNKLSLLLILFNFMLLRYLCQSYSHYCPRILWIIHFGSKVMLRAYSIFNRIFINS